MEHNSWLLKLCFKILNKILLSSKYPLSDIHEVLVSYDSGFGTFRAMVLRSVVRGHGRCQRDLCAILLLAESHGN